MKQVVSVLHMANHSELINTLTTLIDDGHEISVVTPMRDFKDPDMSGFVVTDWLIIYKEARRKGGAPGNDGFGGGVMAQRSVKRHYVSVFGLPESQLRFFDELTKEQVEDVKRLFSAGLVGVDRYIYAIKQNGELVPARERRRPEFGG